MDEKEVRITADNLTYSAYQSTMDLLIENNSDQDLSVISGSIGFQAKNIRLSGLSDNRSCENRNFRLVSAGLVSSGDTKATLLELENTGAMKYGISKSSLEDNKIGTDDITMVSFQLNISSGSFYNYIDQLKLTISYN